jgi:hypothetical protein
VVENTIFDSVFKTMAHKMPKLLIPFINEVFGRRYPRDAEIVQFSNEHETLRGTKIDDTVFRLGSKIYHVECQSTADSNMVVRMIEYDFAIALEVALSSGTPYEMDFPASCVLYLRHNESTPDMLKIKVNLPNGESFLYRTKVVKAQSYSCEDLQKKNLLFLMPFYLMRFEQEIARLAPDATEANGLMAACAELRTALELATLSEGNDLLYEELLELIIKVSDYLLRAHESLRERARKAMGGEVLELMHERAERLRKEALEAGKKEGREEGREEGADQAATAFSEFLKARGVDEGLIEGAVAAVHAKWEASKSQKTQ